MCPWAPQSWQRSVGQDGMEGLRDGPPSGTPASLFRDREEGRKLCSLPPKGGPDSTGHLAVLQFLFKGAKHPNAKSRERGRCGGKGVGRRR